MFSQDNSIAYWRKFVAEYYSPRAKQRWCLALYSNVGHHTAGVLPQATTVSFCTYSFLVCYSMNRMLLQYLLMINLEFKDLME